MGTGFNFKSPAALEEPVLGSLEPGTDFTLAVKVPDGILFPYKTVSSMWKNVLLSAATFTLARAAG